MENISDNSADEFLKNIENRVKKRRQKLSKKKGGGRSSDLVTGDGNSDDDEVTGGDEGDSEYEDIEEQQSVNQTGKETKRQILNRKAEIIR